MSETQRAGRARSPRSRGVRRRSAAAGVPTVLGIRARYSGCDLRARCSWPVCVPASPCCTFLAGARDRIGGHAGICLLAASLSVSAGGRRWAPVPRPPVRLQKCVPLLSVDALCDTYAVLLFSLETHKKCIMAHPSSPRPCAARMAARSFQPGLYSRVTARVQSWHSRRG